MKQYLIYQKTNSQVILRFYASNDTEALKKGLSFLLGLGLTLTESKKNFKIGEIK